MTETTLEASDLTKRFDGFTAVDGLDLTIEKGEIVGLLGVNGAGKTTAMNMMLGLIEPTVGKVRIFGKDLAKERIEILRRMNFSSSYTSLPSNLRVWQNMMVFGNLYGVRGARKKSRELLELFGVSHLWTQVTGQLSSGESTRVNLCKALLNAPNLLMLDEPTASLDPDIADKVRKVIKLVSREREMSVLYTSHNMRDVEEVCDRVVFMHEGRVLTEGTPKEIVKRFKEKSLEHVFIRVARGGDFIEEIVGDGGEKDEG